MTLRQEQRLNFDSQQQLHDSKAARFCAYSKTGQRFISNRVELADASAGDFENNYSSLTPGSGTAVWIVPIRSLSATNFCNPVDLLYLDETCAVLAAVESFPTARVSTSIARAASILALPEHTILTMGIEGGDQLMLCTPEAMQRYLLHAGVASREVGSNWQTVNEDSRSYRWEQSFTEVRDPFDAHAVRTAPGPARVEEKVEEKAEEAETAPVAVSPIPEDKKNLGWWRKLRRDGLFDPRQGVRTALPGLVAYFFTGGAPTPNPVHDISTSGLYVLTPERWYQGTMVRLTLTDVHNPSAERSMTLLAKVVRSTDDGVAFKFGLAEKSEWLRGLESALERLQGGRDGFTDIEGCISFLKSGS
jgi:hypothetical protein